jgi:hypothetical protein
MYRTRHIILMKEADARGVLIPAVDCAQASARGFMTVWAYTVHVVMGTVTGSE